MTETIFTDWRQVLDSVSDARNRGFAFANFYADEERMREWCEDGSFAKRETRDAMLFVHRRSTFSNVFYFARDLEAMGKALEEATASAGRDRCAVIDAIGPDAVRLPVVLRCQKAGFAKVSELVRMSRKTPGGAFANSSGVESATVQDTPRLQDLLERHFEPKVDQLPSAAELERWISRGGVKVSRNAEGLADGFIIYDCRPASLYLRYWFVDPSSRGKGVGSRLANAMFADAAHTKRQYFWVKTGNQDAIDKYLHYGFAFESMKDTVLASAGPGKEQLHERTDS